MNSDLKSLKAEIEQLTEKMIERCDSIQIFATLHNDRGDGSTATVEYGLGNWYARYGQIAEWLIAQDEAFRDKEAKYEDDDGEEVGGDDDDDFDDQHD